MHLHVARCTLHVAGCCCSVLAVKMNRVDDDVDEDVDVDVDVEDVDDGARLDSNGRAYP